MTESAIDYSGVSEAQAPLLDEMAAMLARHKLIPFFGAGISRQHLGLAALELAAEMARVLNKPPTMLLSDLADGFADQEGTAALVDFLRARLIFAELDEAKAPIHRLLVSLCLNVIYTTNQDNLFELTAARYGRPCRRIVTLEDISDAEPGEPQLVKFHGDLNEPSSLVFGTRSYQARLAAKNHPLDIRFQSDLLGKRLLFLGYSLRDENVTKLITMVLGIFGGKMPPSYLLAFEYDSSMDRLSDYGVQVLDPLKLCPGTTDSADAFQRCLKALCDRTIRYQVNRGFKNLEFGGTTNPRLVTDYELDAVARTADTGPFDAALTAFRAVFDQSRVPNNVLRRATDIFLRLVTLVDVASDAQMSGLEGALFNLRLPPVFAAEALAHVMAACNRRPASSGFDHRAALLCPSLPDETRPAAAAMAVAILGERGEVITDNFRSLAWFWFQSFDEVPEPMLGHVKAAIMMAWPGNKAAQSPLSRPRLPFRAKGFHEIHKELMDRLPKRFKSPEGE